MTSAGQLPEDVAHGEANFDVGTALLGEGARVRAWEIELQPGERAPFHCHRSSYCWIAHGDGVARVGFTDGTYEDYVHQAGEVTFIEIPAGERWIHDLTNVGETPLSFTTLELLGGDRLFWRPYASDLAH